MAEGVFSGWVFLMILLKTNMMGLNDLIDGSADGPLALVLLLLAFGTSFGMVGVAWRIMVLLPDRD